jgi:plasmid maintenance system antidote protein VapI
MSRGQSKNSLCRRLRLGRYFGNGAPFWLDLRVQYDIGVVERENGAEIARRVGPADAA